MPRAHLLAQAYGSGQVRTEALYAVWSALAWAGGFPLDVHVYTDEPAAFAPLASRLSLEPVTPERIRAWRGPHDFVHRLKPEMIRDLAARFPEDRLLYVDADVFFTGPLSRAFERIGPGRSVMHAREYHVATHASSQMRKFRSHLGGLAFRGGPIDLSCHMWNAGALGVDPAQFPHLGEWLEFIDEIYPRYPRGLVEQFGISSILQRETTVSAVDDLLFHYWFQRDEYGAAIGRALEGLAAMPYERSLEHLRANPIRLPYRKQRSRLADRVRRFWTGKG
jgi:hypothetical protein